MTPREAVAVGISSWSPRLGNERALLIADVIVAAMPDGSLIDADILAKALTDSQAWRWDGAEDARKVADRILAAI